MYGLKTQALKEQTESLHDPIKPDTAYDMPDFDNMQHVGINVGAAISRPFSLLMVLRAAGCRPYIRVHNQ